MRRIGLPLALLIASLAGCASGPDAGPEAGTGPELATANENDLHYLRLDPAAPPLAQTSVSFYAVRGKDREAAIWYRRRPDRIDSTRLARFRVGKEALVANAQGAPLALGDSVLITMTVVDPSRQLVQLDPSGLTFSAGKPAKLTLWYLETNHDFTGDGVVDAADSALENTFKIWGQERPGDPFVSLPGALGKSGDEVQTEIPGFTRYVVAY